MSYIFHILNFLFNFTQRTFGNEEEELGGFFLFPDFSFSI
jgi:hypothetical protein